MPTLYELGTEWARLETALIEAEGEMTPDVEAALAALGDLERDKIDAYQHIVANLDAHAKACHEEAERLRAKSDVARNAARRLKDHLLAYMQARGVEAIQGDRWRACATKNGGKPPLTVLVEPEQLPASYQRVKVEPDTDALRAGLEQADPAAVAVARLEPRGVHLRFR